jgi:hypothetical protein
MGLIYGFIYVDHLDLWLYRDVVDLDAEGLHLTSCVVMRDCSWVLLSGLQYLITHWFLCFCSL